MGLNFKLHKVGSSTVAAVLENHANEHRSSLRMCKGSPIDRAAQPTDQRCNVINSHRYSANVGLDKFLNTYATGALSVAIFRDPRERLLSRYFFDILHGKINRSIEPEQGSWASPGEFSALQHWLRQNSESEGMHYVNALNLTQYTASNHLFQEQMKAELSRFDVLGVTENIDGLIAAVSARLGCRIDSRDSVWVYKSLKRVAGRPKFEDYPQDIKTSITAAVSWDIKIWQECKSQSLLYNLDLHTKENYDRLRTFIHQKNESGCHTKDRTLINAGLSWHGFDCVSIGANSTNAQFLYETIQLRSNKLWKNYESSVVLQNSISMFKIRPLIKKDAKKNLWNAPTHQRTKYKSSNFNCTKKNKPVPITTFNNTFIVTLQRDVARVSLVINVTNVLKGSNIVWAIDGKHPSIETMIGTWTSQHYIAKNLKHLMDPRYSFGKAKIACLMSHLRVWEHLAHNPDAESYILIMEDDAYPEPGFATKLQKVLGELKSLPVQWDWVYLSVHPRFAHLNTKNISCMQYINLSPRMVGNAAYLLSRQGARKILTQAVPFTNRKMKPSMILSRTINFTVTSLKRQL